MIERILGYVCVFLALIIVLPLHEFAHAFVAVKCGDGTPKAYGRYTLNPMSHFDAYGLICFVFAGFGWAKPVPVNPYNFKNYKWGSFFVSIAGVTANFLLAFLVYPLFELSLKVPEFGYFTYVLQFTLFYIVSMSLSFTVFNLLPIYPLDGFRVIDAFSKKRSNVYRILRNYGTYILLGLFALSILADASGVYQIDILGNVLSIAVKYLQIPITAFWGLFF